MALNDILQATIRSNVGGEKIANVIHFKQTSADGALPQNEDLVAAIIEDLVPALADVMSSDGEIVDAIARRVSPAVGGSYVGPINEAGTVAQDTSPTQSCAVATLYSDTLTRKGRGRIHIGAVPDTFITNGCLTNASSATYVSFLALLLAAIQGGTGATFQAGVFNPDDLTFHAYTAHQLRSTVRTLRSRRISNP